MLENVDDFWLLMGEVFFNWNKNKCLEFIFWSGVNHLSFYIRIPGGENSKFLILNLDLDRFDFKYQVQIPNK